MKRVKYVANFVVVIRISGKMTTKLGTSLITIVMLCPHFVADINGSGHRQFSVVRLCPHLVADINGTGHRQSTVVRLCPHLVAVIHRPSEFLSSELH